MKSFHEKSRVGEKRCYGGASTDSQAFEFINQAPPGYPEQIGRFCTVALCLFQGPADIFDLAFFQGFYPGLIVADGRWIGSGFCLFGLYRFLNHGRQVFGKDYVGLRQESYTFDGIGKLAHIALPGISLEGLSGRP